jgi:hypothetical protein
MGEIDREECDNEGSEKFSRGSVLDWTTQNISVVKANEELEGL